MQQALLVSTVQQVIITYQGQLSQIHAPRPSATHAIFTLLKMIFHTMLSLQTRFPNKTLPVQRIDWRATD